MSYKKVFISYSWTTQEWVIKLAGMLVSNGVDVCLDVWDLKPGHDKYDFMEQMVKASDIDKVLMVIDRRYAENSDKREGGVGTETQIISDGIYRSVKQEKFIPICREFNDNKEAYLPVFLRNRVYLDFSNEEKFEDRFNELLHNIHDRTIYSKPPLGDSSKFQEVQKKSNNESSKLSIHEKALQVKNKMNSKQERLNYLKSPQAIIDANDATQDLISKLKEHKLQIESAFSIPLGMVNDQQVPAYAICFKNYCISITCKSEFQNYYSDDITGRPEGYLLVALYTRSGTIPFDYREEIDEEVRLKFDRDQSGINGWSELDTGENFITSEELLEKWINKFIDGINVLVNDY